MLEILDDGLDIRRGYIPGVYTCMMGKDRSSTGSPPPEAICTLQECECDFDEELDSPEPGPIQLTYQGLHATLRQWDPYSCVLAAAIHKCFIHFPIRPGSCVFAIGCSLSTLGHISDILGRNGRLIAVTSDSMGDTKPTPEQVAKFSRRYPRSTVVDVDIQCASFEGYMRLLSLPEKSKYAFLMGLHPRLGEASPVRLLAEDPPKLVGKIFDFLINNDGADVKCFVACHWNPGTRIDVIREIVLSHIDIFQQWRTACKKDEEYQEPATEQLKKEDTFFGGDGGESTDNEDGEGAGISAAEGRKSSKIRKRSKEVDPLTKWVFLDVPADNIEENSSSDEAVIGLMKRLTSGLRTGLIVKEKLLLTPFFPTHSLLLLKYQAHRDQRTKKLTKHRFPLPPGLEDSNVGEGSEKKRSKRPKDIEEVKQVLQAEAAAQEQRMRMEAMAMEAKEQQASKPSKEPKEPREAPAEKPVKEPPPPKQPPPPKPTKAQRSEAAPARAPPDHMRGAPPDHMRAPPDHMRAPPDHMRAPPDHMRAPPDHMRAPPDHMRALQEPMRVQQDPLRVPQEAASSSSGGGWDAPAIANMPVPAFGGGGGRFQDTRGGPLAPVPEAATASAPPMSMASAAAMLRQQGGIDPFEAVARGVDPFEVDALAAAEARLRLGPPMGLDPPIGAGYAAAMRQLGAGRFGPPGGEVRGGGGGPSRDAVEALASQAAAMLLGEQLGMGNELRGNAPPGLPSAASFDHPGLGLGSDFGPVQPYHGRSRYPNPPDLGGAGQDVGGYPQSLPQMNSGPIAPPPGLWDGSSSSGYDLNAALQAQQQQQASQWQQQQRQQQQEQQQRVASYMARKGGVGKGGVPAPAPAPAHAGGGKGVFFGGKGAQNPAGRNGLGLPRPPTSLADLSLEQLQQLQAMGCLPAGVTRSEQLTAALHGALSL